jgi:hypothetical protein
MNEASTGHFANRGEPCVAMQGPARSGRCEQGAGQYDQQANARQRHGGQKALAQTGVVGIELPVGGDAAPLGLPGVCFAEHQK